MTRKAHLALASCIALGLSSLALGCTPQQKGSTSATTSTSTETVEHLPIAYVQMDSISSQYKYAQEIKSKLEKDATASQTRLASKAAAFQKAAQDFERRARINAFVSQESAQAEQEKVLKLQQEAQILEAQLSQELAQKQALMMEDMLKEVKEKLKEYNKDGKYKLILTNVGVDNILYGSEELDITADFVKYLNENYQSSDLSASADTTKTNKK